MTKKQVLIVELMSYHGFLICPQIYFLLDAGYEVTVFINSSNKDKSALEVFHGRIKVIEAPRWPLRQWLMLNSKQFDFVIFNTVQSLFSMVAALLTFTEMRYIYHNEMPHVWFLKAFLNKLVERKASKIFALSEHICALLRDEVSDVLKPKMSWFDPSYFEDFMLEPQQAEDVVFVIPGPVTQPQRNYQPVIDAFEKIMASALKDRIKIYLLGNYLTEVGRKILQRADETGLLGSVLKFQYEKYSSFEQFTGEFQRSHFLLPSLDHSTYNIYKMSYNIKTVPTSLMFSRAFAMPIVVSDTFNLDENLQPFSVRYSGDDVFEGIVKAVELVDSGHYGELRSKFKAYMQVRFKTSQANYLAENQSHIG